MRNAGKPCRHASNIDDDQAEELEKLVNRDQETVSEKPKKVSKSSTPPVASSGAASSSSAPPAPSTPVVPPASHGAWPPLPPTAPTREDAAKYLPVVTGCTITTHSNKAWESKYKRRSKYPRSHTITFDPENATSCHEAVIECIAWTWHVHKQEQPDIRCPYKFKEYKFS